MDYHRSLLRAPAGKLVSVRVRTQKPHACNIEYVHRGVQTNVERCTRPTRAHIVVPAVCFMRATGVLSKCGYFPNISVWREEQTRSADEIFCFRNPCSNLSFVFPPCKFIGARARSRLCFLAVPTCPLFLILHTRNSGWRKGRTISFRVSLVFPGTEETPGVKRGDGNGGRSLVARQIVAGRPMQPRGSLCGRR